MSVPPPSKTAGRRAGIALAVLALLAALVACAVWVVPAWLASRLEDEIGSALGRRVAIGELAISWIPGTATVADVAIGGARAAEPAEDERAVLRLARLSLELSWGALLDREIHLRALRLASPVLHLERDAQGELAPLVLAADDQDGPEDDAEATEGWPVHLDALAVENLRVVIEQEGGAEREVLVLGIEALSIADLAFVDGVADVGALTLDDPSLVVHPALRGPDSAADGDEPETEGDETAGDDAPGPDSRQASPAEDPLGRHRLASLEIRDATFALRRDGSEDLEVGLRLTAQDLSLAQGGRFPLEAEVTLGDGSLSAKGELGARPLAYDGSLSWSDLPLARLLPGDEDDDADRWTVEQATAHGDAQLSLRTDVEGEAPPRVEISGRARITEAAGSLPDGRFAWQELDAEVARLRIPLVPGQPLEVELSRVAMRAPELDLARVPSEPALDAAGADGDRADGDDVAPRVRVAALAVEDGMLHFRDEAPPNDFETRWRKVAVSAEGLRWPERDVQRFDLDADGPSGARLRVDASLEGGRGTIETEVERLGLPPLNPYAARYTGIAIDRGQGSLSGTVTIGADQTSADSRVFLHELRVTEEEPGWFRRFFGMPLDVTLALLRDIQGDITLPVRVEIARDQRELNLGRLIASTLRQAILGAVTTPVKLLGGLANVAGAALGPALEPLPAVPGAARLRDPDADRLRELVSMLSSRPQLAVALHGRAGPEDTAGIRRRTLVERARSDAPLSGVDDALRERLAALEPDGPPEIPPELAARIQPLLDAIPVDEAAYLDLARERARWLRATLVRDYGIEEDDVSLEQALVGEPGVLIELRASPVSPGASG